jgi:hypothetical protein
VPDRAVTGPKASARTHRFAPVAARARVALVLLVPWVVVTLAAGLLVDGPLRIVLVMLSLVAAAGSVVRGLGVALVVDDGGVEIRNVRRRVRLATTEIEAVGERRVGLGPLRARAVELRGRTGATVATITVGASSRQLAPLFVILRRWSVTGGTENELERLEFLDRRTRGQLLRSGDDVAVPCHLRRMSSRGWGPWVEGWLRLQPPGVGSASWRADDPAEVALVQSHGERPVWVRDAVRIEARPVRYKAESFYRDATDIVVYTTERTQMELACSATELPVVLARLQASSHLEGTPQAEGT